MRPALIATAALLLVSACSYFDKGGNWTQPGASSEQMHSDLGSCEAAARSQTKVDRGIDQDIAATQGGGAFGDPLADSGVSGYRTGKRYDDIVDECMRAFGYVRQ
ncbi:hypothetical protein [Dongia sp.]|uniref:hypothetical protein n=1 Tax=Dongia sp. TaxID=1977262 RepID=UPI0035B0E32C